jgi:hypothetical protein
VVCQSVSKAFSKRRESVETVLYDFSMRDSLYYFGVTQTKSNDPTCPRVMPLISQNGQKIVDFMAWWSPVGGMKERKSM